MSRICDICHKEATSSSEAYYDLSFSENGSWYPEYAILVLCYEDFIAWLQNNPYKLVLAERVYDPIRG